KLAQLASPLNGQNCELTGTGDGKLYGFFVTVPAQIAEIRKGGQIGAAKELAGVATGTDYAFSFWGGDFYLYTALNQSGLPANDNSSVTRYRPSDGSVTQVIDKVGFRITGAGVSTCAPTTLPPPK